MSTYLRKAIQVSAFRLGYDASPEWAINPSVHLPMPDQDVMTYAMLDTSRGEVTVAKGDWIIMRADGSFYSCTDDAFSANYEAVE